MTLNYHLRPHNHNQNKTLVLIDNQKKEPPNSMVPKISKKTPTAVLNRALFPQGGGGGRSLCYIKCIRRVLGVAFRTRHRIVSSPRRS